MKVLQNFPCLWLVLVFSSSSARAQGSADNIDDIDREIDDTNRRTTYLKDRELPLDWAQLYKELTDAEQELLTPRAPRSQRIANLQDTCLKALNTLISSSGQTHCEVPGELQSLHSMVENTCRDVPAFDMSNADHQATEFQTHPDAKSCKAFQEWMSKNWGALLGRQQQRGADWKVELSKEQASLKNLKEVLDARRERLRAAFSQVKDSVKSQDTIANSLIGYLIVLTVFGLLMFGAIRLFPPLQQIQWIRSGQVIQTMTVIVLLFAILALGLSNKLKEDNLGTLLGGVAGYVLSTGIRRAAGGGGDRQRDNHATNGSGRKGGGDAPNGNPGTANAGSKERPGEAPKPT